MILVETTWLCPLHFPHAVLVAEPTSSEMSAGYIEAAT